MRPAAASIRVALALAAATCMHSTICGTAVCDASSSTADKPCPCADEKLCRPIAIQHEREVNPAAATMPVGPCLRDVWILPRRTLVPTCNAAWTAGVWIQCASRRAVRRIRLGSGEEANGCIVLTAVLCSMPSSAQRSG